MPVSIVVNTRALTLFEDEAGASPLQIFSINDLNSSDFVRIEGQEVNGEFVASVVKRIDTDDSRLQGAVDTFVATASITILGITYSVDHNPRGTAFLGFADSAAFFAQLNIDDLIKIKDKIIADGIADEVEKEN